MITQIILFIVSLVIILAIISIKSFEIKREKMIFSKELRERSDKRLRSFYFKFSTFFKKVWLTIVLFIKKVIHYLAHLFIDVWEFLARKSVRYINAIRGKGVLKNKGAASFFINAIVDHKEEMRNNRSNTGA